MKRSSLLFGLTFSLLFAQEGARYLIITHDNFYNIVQPLAQWKHKKGMMCKVVRLSEVGNTPNAIRDYVVNAYNSWPIRPEYLLLVGSPSLLTSYYYSAGHQNRVYTDNYYANVTGDYRAEIPYGRLPCKNAFQCSVMVAKILFYEQKPNLLDSLWIVKGVGIVNEDGSSDDTIYWGNVRFACQRMGEAGFIQVDTFSRFRGNSANDVINAVNNGRGIILYRGSGVGNWYNPFNVNVSLCNNPYKLPIAASITCQTLTLAPTESMVGDAWMKVGTPSQPKGAVAFFGNTHSATNIAPVRSVCTRGFFRTLFSNDYQLGKALLSAKESIFVRFNNQLEYYGFNLLGDPELNVLTGIPKPLSVFYPETIELGSREVGILVKRLSLPIPNALVCLWKGGEVYKYGYTNVNGEILFNVNPISEGDMLLTVTARNSIPFEGRIVCVTQTGVLEEKKAEGERFFSVLLQRDLASLVKDGFEIYDFLGKRVEKVSSGVYFLKKGKGLDKIIVIK